MTTATTSAAVRKVLGTLIVVVFVAAGCGSLAELDEAITSTTTATTSTSPGSPTSTGQPSTSFTPPSEWTPGDGSQSGLVPVATPADRAAGVAVIAQLATAGRGPKTGYERDAFGPSWTDDHPGLWGHNGCDTRNDVLHRDLVAVEVRAGTHGCVAIAGVLADPYSGTTMTFAKEHAGLVQIDHIYPLALAWQMGAAHWPEAKRIAFANDPRNLIAVNGSLNASKGASGPASWLPPHKVVRCAYVARWAAVAVAYDLAVPAPDKAMAADQCR